ncbi:hypothetical protein C4559_04630 [Candidatus Microgenomates bacterium]|nr:MAG: hypothetical protein C4559_04630 [Candidatus Microgenomates bacterium]
MKNSTIITIVLLIIVGIGAFFGGTKYQESKTSNNRQAQVFRQRMGGTGGQNFRPVRGEILSKDDKSLTVKLPDGSSKIVFLSGKTVFLKSSTGSKDDLKSGENVVAMGTENSDGSITAQDIQINPPVKGNFNK